MKHTVDHPLDHYELLYIESKRKYKNTISVLTTAFVLLGILFIIAIFDEDHLIHKSHQIINSVETIYLPDTVKNHNDYLKAIRKMESSGDYYVINRFGYSGAYQFGKAARKEVKLGTLTTQEFLKYPQLQDIAMNMYLCKNKEYLCYYIGKYCSTTIKNIYITESGLLAGAHLVGSQGVIIWLESKGKIDPVDGNGRKVSENIKDFGGYKLNL